MKRKVVSVILATAMVASMVAGCGGSKIGRASCRERV